MSRLSALIIGFLFVLSLAAASVVSIAVARAEGVLPVTPVTAAGVVSCECENSQCGPCETEVGTSFYSAKCGPGHTRVKSCKKPTCVAVENQKTCLADLAAKSNAPVAALTPVTKTAPEAPKVRALASETVPSGEIVQLAGSALVTRARGAKEPAREKLAIFEGDLIETKSDSKVKIRLFDSSDAQKSSELVVVSNSRLKISTAAFNNASGVRAVTLNLLSGKVRSQVRQKYDSADNTFRVQTRAAVAGVRGTDFVTSFDPGAGGWRTEIRTLDGLVRLSAGSEDTPGKIVEIAKAEYAAFVVEQVPGQADEVSDIEAEKAIVGGSMSPVFKMPDDDMKLLDEATDFKKLEASLDSRSQRFPASGSNDSVCTEPHGDFNQCSWTCEGNPSGEKRCRTDLPGVNCVRRLCRANGQWAEPKRLPANQSDFCEVGKVTVRSCGSYW